jgi:glycerol-3-phosphate acyltransferase PlsY
MFHPAFVAFCAALVAVVAYLLGSIPFGLLLTRFAGLGDVREIGSGNIGATNVLRTGNKGLAVATLLLDAGKGVAAVVLVRLLATEPRWLEYVAAAAVLIGHCYPVWLKFKGGKGVATFFGIAFALWWPLGVLAAMIWLSLAFMTRYSSLGALAAVGSTPIFAHLLGYNDLASLFAFVGLLIGWKHRGNIKRLLDGSEPKLGRKPEA